MRRMSLSLVVATALLAAGSCSNSLSSLTTPTTPATILTDTFSGTLTQNGAFGHEFVTSALGAITITILSLSPTTTLGMSLGVWNGSACVVSGTAAYNDTATTGSTITLNGSGAGTFCFRLYDVGFLTSPVIYELEVQHP